MSKVFYDKPIIEQLFDEFDKDIEDHNQEKLIKLVKILPPEDINKYNKHGQTSLLLASYYGYTTIVKLLLKNEDIIVNIRSQSSSTEPTALIYASKYGNIEIVKLLLNHKDIDINYADNIGYRALLYAICNEHTEIVELLLNHKDINITIAREKGCAKISEVLENYIKN